MKYFLLILLSLTLSAPLLADLTIVQEVVTNNLTLTGNQNPLVGNQNEMTIYVSKGKTRIEHTQVGMILAPDESKNIMLMHAQKNYMIMPSIDTMVNPMAEKDPKSFTSQKQLSWEKTGKKEKIAGFDAEQWIGKNKDGKIAVEVWMGGKPEYMNEYIDSLSKLGKSSMGKMAEEIEACRDAPPYKEGYPLKSVSYNDKGVMETTTTVKKLDASPVDAKWFVIPEGYSEMKMPSMGQMPAGGSPGQLPSDGMDLPQSSE